MESYILTGNQPLQLEYGVLKKAGFKPGQKLQVILGKGRIEILPYQKSLKGFLKGIDTEIKREKDRL